MSTQQDNNHDQVFQTTKGKKKKTSKLAWGIWKPTNRTGNVSSSKYFLYNCTKQKKENKRKEIDSISLEIYFENLYRINKLIAMLHLLATLPPLALSMMKKISK